MKKTRYFLFFSAVIMMLLCSGVFVWMVRLMDRVSENSIQEIGSIYMAEMNRHIQQKFVTMMDLRLNQLEGLVKRTPPTKAIYGKNLLDELSLNAEVREFNYLGLYTPQGAAETVYGAPVILAQAEEFLEKVNMEGVAISYGTDGRNRRLVMLGVKASYPMKDGQYSAAIVAGFPMEEVNNSLFLYENNTLSYSHIIDSDGKLIIRTHDTGYDNYFQKAGELFSPRGNKTAAQQVTEIRRAMQENNSYSALIRVGSDRQRQHLYLSSLPNTDWFLITTMPQQALESAVSRLGEDRARVTLWACAVVLFVFLLIFAYYYMLSYFQVKRLDAAKRESDRANKAKSEFLSNMSHDIRTPMNAVVGMTAIALNNLQDSSRVQDCLKKIQLSSKHLLGLINDILDMSKIESGKLTLNIGKVSLREIMNDMLSIIQPQIRAKKQRFEVFIQHIITENICCDSLRLNQILLNLLSNSMKFTPEGGSVKVYLSQEASPLGADFVRTRLRVTDTGIGMSAEFKAKIFESFSREDSARVQKTMGTGLGMAITKYLVDAMGGEIDVQSEPDKGTEFNITLDFQKAPGEQEEMHLPAWKMLVVDDSPELCESAVSELTALGVHAESVCDGENAVKKMEEARLGGRDYDMVLVDWQMPGMDGVQTIRKMHERIGKDIPLFLISAYDWSAVEEEARAAGVSGFIAKPLFKSTLFYGLNQYAEHPVRVEQPVEAAVCSLQGKRVLLAEDNELNWEVAREILADAGVEAEWAQNGQICVDKFMASAPGYYQAVLMDIRMPVMTGYEAARAVRSAQRADNNIPIIAMTADAFAEDIQRCLESGMNAHTAKPINPQELLRLLCQHMGLVKQQVP